MASANILMEEKKQYGSSSQWGINKRRNKKTDSREIGLEIGSILGKYFLKLDHLHYGYWTKDLEVDISNIRIAQENYANFLISHIPEDVETILDVGCGMGQIAKKLLDMGYHVDCVSPSPFLTKHARDLLGNRSNIFECYYQQLQTDSRYDLVLFSESFQYIDIEEAIKRTVGSLNHDGYMLICDFFKKDAPWKSTISEGHSLRIFSFISGGHSLRIFYDIVSKYPLRLIKDLDITDETAPTLDIVNDALKKAVHPAVLLAQQLLDDRYPFMSKSLKWVYRKKINKINKKYFTGENKAENFKKFKSYRLLLYRKTISN
ncbi:MAG: class I SAM-dependent methyltransferase [Phycisphaerae bacterium]